MNIIFFVSSANRIDSLGKRLTSLLLFDDGEDTIDSELSFFSDDIETSIFCRKIDKLVSNCGRRYI